MKVSELFREQGVRIDGADVDVTSLCYDSRRVVGGALFAAWSGARSDGHEHVASAVAAGASSILCERPVDTGGATRVLAADSRLALALAAKRFFGDPSAHLRTVGVTGTNGKTTVVTLLHSIFAAAGIPAGTIGTLGTRFGDRRSNVGLTTPQSVDLVETLAMMRQAGMQALAMEVSSHALAQHRVAGVSYDVGVFTNLTQDHLDYHGTLEAYFEAKARLLRERLKQRGAGVVNADDPWTARLLGLPNVIGFSVAGAATAAVRAARLVCSRGGLELTVTTPRGSLELRAPLVGRFNAENILAAVGAAEALGLPPDAIVRGVASVAPPPGRLQRVGAPADPFVVVDYAHTPDALRRVLATLREIATGRVICVFGCGGDRDPTKREPMGRSVAELADAAVLTNDNPRTEAPEVIAAAVERGLRAGGMAKASAPAEGHYVVELERAAAIAAAVCAAAPDDVVLVAGKGHEQVQIIGKEERPFSDVSVVERALADRRSRDGT